MRMFAFVLLFLLSACATHVKTENHLSQPGTKQYPQKPKENAPGLPVGTWEGILPDEASFKVLRIQADGHHSLTSYAIVLAMKQTSEVHFTDEDVHCDAFECEITTQSAGEKLPLRITLTPFINTHFLTTEAIIASKTSLYSAQYTLTPVKNETIPDRFIRQQGSDVARIAEKYKQQRFGFWAGVLYTSGDAREKFATLAYLPNKKATFTVYSPGFHEQAVMTFEPSWLQQEEGELITRLEGAPFASELRLRYEMMDVIKGNYEQRFTRYPERLFGQGNFQLYRVDLNGPRELPVWLKNLLENTD